MPNRTFHWFFAPGAPAWRASLARIVKARLALTRRRPCRAATIAAAVTIALAIVYVVGCSRASGISSDRLAKSDTHTAVDATSPDDAAVDARLGEARMRLRILSGVMDPCSQISSEIAEIDSLLDAAPNSAQAFHLLGEALRLASEACPSHAPRARHATRAGDAFAEAKRRAAADAGLTSADDACAPGRALTEGHEMVAAARWAEAAAAYRRELYGAGCPAELHWHGTILQQRGAGRLGLARAAIALQDEFEARRQLRLLDLERSGAALHIGDKDAEAKLWEKLGPSPPVASALRVKSPEDALRQLERAAVADDADAFIAALAHAAPDRTLLAGRHVSWHACDLRVGDAPTRLRMCILIDLVPEAPRAVACTQATRGRATCRVTGAAGDMRAVTLIAEEGAFRVLSSERLDP